MKQVPHIVIWLIHFQLLKLVENLTRNNWNLLTKTYQHLNTVYELQRKGANDHIKESETLYKGIQELMKDLSESAGDTKKYREQITKLNDNLSALNNVYGNMLSAMNVK